MVSKGSKEAGEIAGNGLGREVDMNNRDGILVHENFIWEGATYHVQRGNDGEDFEGTEVSSTGCGLVYGGKDLHGHGEDNLLIVPC